MVTFFKKNPAEKELEKLIKTEEKYIMKKMEKREGIINRIVSDKVPEKLHKALETGFFKAFKLLFKGGTDIIEKTYNSDKIKKEYEEREEKINQKNNRKNLKSFSKKAEKAGRKNLLISGTIGIGTGFIGVGLPDIPVLSSIILKSIYETSANYGFHHRGASENFFMLRIIEGAVTCGKDFMEIDQSINDFIETGKFPEGYNEEEEIRTAARYLSDEMIYTKFVQGIPFVGVAGGMYDALYMKNISEYSDLKYRKRFLKDKI